MKYFQLFLFAIIVVLLTSISDGRIIPLDDPPKICNGFTGVNQCSFGPDHGCFQLCTAFYKRAIISAFCEEAATGTTQCRCTFEC
ncbi:hypothetical protein P3S67_012464 [Capsicum chacoense]